MNIICGGSGTLWYGVVVHGGCWFTITDATWVGTKDAGHGRWRDTAERRKDRDGTEDGYDIHAAKMIADSLWIFLCWPFGGGEAFVGGADACLASEA
jgi:imidazole glycerol phosphate synthase subunit HisF